MKESIKSSSESSSLSYLHCLYQLLLYSLQLWQDINIFILLIALLLFFFFFSKYTIHRCFGSYFTSQSENIYMQWESYKITNCNPPVFVGSYLHCISFCVNLHSRALEKAVSATALLGLAKAWTQQDSKALKRFVRSHQHHSSLPVRRSTEHFF